MEAILQIREEMGRLTPERVEQYIADGRADELLLSLDGLDASLGSLSHEQSDLHQRMHHAMIAFVGRVRKSFNGRS